MGEEEEDNGKSEGRKDEWRWFGKREMVLWKNIRARRPGTYESKQGISAKGR